MINRLYQLTRNISTLLPLSQGIALATPNSPTRHHSLKIQGRHWAVIAKTGDGKTTFDKALLREYRMRYPGIHTYILDTKHLGDFSALDGQVISSETPPPLLTKEGGRQIWQPMGDNLDAYDHYFRSILNAGHPALVLIDESKNLKIGQRGPKGYELLLSQGRLPGIFCITNYQEIANGLRQGLSQATHIVVMGLNNPYDEQIARISLKMGKHETFNRPNAHALRYINVDSMEKAVLYSGYQDCLREVFRVRRGTR